MGQYRVLVAFVLVLIFCANTLRTIQWNNANEMGASLVKNYSAAEEHRINTFRTVLDVCGSYVEQREAAGASPAELRSGLRALMEGLTDTYDAADLQIYGKVSLVEDSFDLSDTIDSILTVFRSQADAKQQTLTLHIIRLDHEKVIGDEQHLQQIFMNIMGNAVKFTPAGGSITIHIEEKPSHISGSGYYEFAFEDTGIGMEPEYIKTIFEPFSRAANSSGNKIEGTGLGMSIAVNIARMMDGDIKVESTLGKGSTFTVMVHLKLDDASDNLSHLSPLPVLVVDDDPVVQESTCELIRSLGLEAQSASDGASVLDHFQQQDFSGKRVLLVEDNEINIEVAQELLSIVGIQVEPALNGQLALDRVKETPPGYYDLIFMDIQMPVMNGYEAAKAIRGLADRPDLKTIPIIAMTADAFSDDIRKSKAAGMDDHISKPVDLNRLETALQRWIKPEN